MLKLILPFPPSVNTYWRIHNNRILTSVVAREYRTKCDWAVMQQRGAVNLSGRLSVAVILHPPDRRKRDIDNYVKSLFDSLTRSGVWVDDELVDELHVTRGGIIPGGKVVVTISALKGEGHEK